MKSYKIILLQVILSVNILLAQTEINFPKFRIYPSTLTQTEPVMAASPINNSILFASAVTLNVGGGFSSEGVYVSTDSGINWSGSDTCKGFFNF